tara:strand:- start:97 stop:711 length:615 start_codon:yes stop_codon:yes gene_type:complete
VTVFRTVSILAGLLALTGCGENTVNKDFEQQMKEREAANSGDPYATLETSMPKQLLLTYRSLDQQQDYAVGQSGTFRSTYDTLLVRLDGDKNVDLEGEPGKSCRIAFASASAYQKDSGNNAAAAADLRDEVLGALRACRAAAKEAGDKGQTLARFASTGIAMTGAKVVGQGDRELGLKVWGEGEKLAGKDKPGFELNAKSLGGK